MQNGQSGWVKIYRKIQEWEFYFSEPFDKTHAWLDLLVLANHAGKTISVRGNLVRVERGEIGWSEENLARRWQWSREKLRRFKKMLESRQQIRIENNFVLSKISIVNYDEYQVSETADETADRTAERRQKDGRPYTNKNEKNYKNEKKETLCDEPSAVAVTVPKKPKRTKEEKEAAEARPMNLAQFLAWCEKSSQKHIGVIGSWAAVVEPDLQTLGQWNAFIRRNLRTAQQVAPFTLEQIKAAMGRIMEGKEKGWLNKYTMETLLKFLTDGTT